MRPTRWMLLAIAAWALVAHADGDRFTLEAVLERIRPADGRFASEYHQVRHSSLLSEPVRVRGRVVFTAPDRLRRTERGPDGGQRTITVRGDTVRIDDAEGTSRYALGQAPTLALLMEVLEALAAGDAQRLRDALDARLAGNWPDWRIVLAAPVPAPVPGGREAEPGADQAQITLAGAGGRLGSIAIDSPRSGRIEIRFTAGDTR